MPHEIDTDARAVLKRNLYLWDASQSVFRRQCGADETTEDWEAEAAVIPMVNAPNYRDAPEG